jgi:hypothetical protein
MVDRHRHDPIHEANAISVFDRFSEPTRSPVKSRRNATPSPLSEADHNLWFYNFNQRS